MLRRILLVAAIVMVVGFFVPETRHFPVEGGSPRDFNKDSFWSYPWGFSGVHKGIDIFGDAGTPVVAAAPGLVIIAGKMGMGGNVVIVLGSKWRLHYYAHLQSADASPGQLLASGASLGTLGDSGNAKGKPPHLHYTVLSLLPNFWHYDGTAIEGWKKMFFLDPGKYLEPATQISG